MLTASCCALVHCCVFTFYHSASSSIPKKSDACLRLLTEPKRINAAALQSRVSLREDKACVEMAFFLLCYVDTYVIATVHSLRLCPRVAARCTGTAWFM